VSVPGHSNVQSASAMKLSGASGRKFIGAPVEGRTPSSIRRPTLPPECVRPRTQQHPICKCHEIIERLRSYVHCCARDGRTPLVWQAQAFVIVPETRTPPRPFLAGNHQARLHWILLDIFLRPSFMFLIAHECIPITVLPEFSAPPQDFVRLLGGKSFPGIEQL
jgi:hypothetical protein